MSHGVGAQCVRLATSAIQITKVASANGGNARRRRMSYRRFATAERIIANTIGKAAPAAAASATNAPQATIRQKAKSVACWRMTPTSDVSSTVQYRFTPATIAAKYAYTISVRPRPAVAISSSMNERTCSRHAHPMMFNAVRASKDFCSRNVANSSSYRARHEAGYKRINVRLRRGFIAPPAVANPRARNAEALQVSPEAPSAPWRSAGKGTGVHPAEGVRSALPDPGA